MPSSENEQLSNDEMMARLGEYGIDIKFGPREAGGRQVVVRMRDVGEYVASIDNLCIGDVDLGFTHKAVFPVTIGMEVKLKVTTQAGGRGHDGVVDVDPETGSLRVNWEK